MVLAGLIMAWLMAGLLAGFRTGFISANKLGIEFKKKQGKRSGRILSAFVAHPYKFHTGVLIGIIFFMILFALLFIALIRKVWKTYSIDQLDHYLVLAWLVYLILGTVLLSWIQFTLKGLFKAKSDQLTDRWSGFMDWVNMVLSPFTVVFGFLSNWMAKYIFNLQVEKNNEHFTSYDIDYFYKQGEESGTENNELNEELLENALNLPGVKVRNCLVPRKEIVGIPETATIEALQALLVQSQLSRIVVYKDSIDHITGYVHQLDMFNKPATIRDIMLPIPAVPETMSVTDLMDKLSKERKSIAWVVDEFGGTAGIVTMEDLLEEIFGEIRDEYDTDELVEKKTGVREYLFSGRLKLDYLTDTYGFEWGANDSETLSGYIVSLHDQFPAEGDQIILGNYRFEVVSIANAKIELVKMELLG